VSDLELPVSAVVRAAGIDDVRALARLHASRIGEGFLPTLGAAFLTRLYRRIVRSPRGCAYVVVDGSEVVAYCAGATDVGALYKEFIFHDGIVAGAVAAPRVVRSWRRVLETLRYPATAAGLPRAEVLAVATADRALGRGFGATAVRAATAELARRGAPAVKVTVGAANEPALAMYRRCGFTRAARINVHGGTESEVLVWKAP
jgi:ribosomal protein S18 acetylase RimI-like enzyme